METNELMIGDWVSYVGKDFNDFADKISGIIDGCVTLDKEMIHRSIDKIHPIPLTEEILVKNGFVKNRYGEMILDEELGTSEIYIVLEPTYDEEYYWWGVNYVLITKIKSVHELQHVLRLVGIEKEIIV